MAARDVQAGMDTARLHLEPLVAAHADELFPVLSNREIYRYLDYGPPESLGYLRDLYARLQAGGSADGTEIWLNWLVRLGSGPAIGYVQATVYPASRAYIAYVLAPECWGRGYAFEAATCMLAHLGSTHPVPRYLAVIEVENLRSARLLARMGFEPADGADHRVALEPSERLYARAALREAGPQ